MKPTPARRPISAAHCRGEPGAPHVRGPLPCAGVGWARARAKWTRARGQRAPRGRSLDGRVGGVWGLTRARGAGGTYSAFRSLSPLASERDKPQPRARPRQMTPGPRGGRAGAERGAAVRPPKAGAAEGLPSAQEPALPPGRTPVAGRRLTGEGGGPLVRVRPVSPAPGGSGPGRPGAQAGGAQGSQMEGLSARVRDERCPREGGREGTGFGARGGLGPPVGMRLPGPRAGRPGRRSARGAPSAAPAAPAAPAGLRLLQPLHGPEWNREASCRGGARERDGPLS